VQGLVVGHLLCEFVGAGDVLGVARERDPAEGSATATEQRSDVFGRESGNVEGIVAAPLVGDLPTDVVPVRERSRAAVLQGEHRVDVAFHRVQTPLDVGVGVTLAQVVGFGGGVAVGIVAFEFVVRGGHVGQHVRDEVAFEQAFEQRSRVGFRRHTVGLAGLTSLPDGVDGRVHVVDAALAVALVDAAVDALATDLGDETGRAVHRRRERLIATHPAEAGGHERPPGERAVVVLAGTLRERLVGSLQHPLCADVRPRPRGVVRHHRQAHLLELPEVLVGVVLADEVRVRQQHPRGALVRSDAADGLARLDDQGLVVGQLAEFVQNRVVGVPRPGRPSDAAVHHEVLRAFGHLGVEVVVEQPKCGLLSPAFALDVGSGRCATISFPLR